MKQRRFVIALLMLCTVILCTGCQVTTESGMYRSYWGWRAFRDPNLIFERYALSEKQPALHGHQLKCHFFKWHDQSYKDPRYTYAPQPVVSQRGVTPEEVARQSTQKLPPPEETRTEKRVPEPRDDIPDVLNTPSVPGPSRPTEKPSAKSDDGPIAQKPNPDREVTAIEKKESTEKKKSGTAQASHKKSPPKGLIEPPPEPEKNEDAEEVASPSAGTRAKQFAAGVWKSDRITAALRSRQTKTTSTAKKTVTSEDDGEAAP